jgi:hypothetical protein
MILGRNLDHTCRDSNGLILKETPAIMNRWKQYFQDLLGGSETKVNYMKKKMAQETNEVKEMPIKKEYLTIEFIKNAIVKLK